MLVFTASLQEKSKEILNDSVLINTNRGKLKMTEIRSLRHYSQCCNINIFVSDK